MRFLDAGVDHFYENFVELRERNHQLLIFLHLAEVVLRNYHLVVEEQVVLASELNFDVLNLVYPMPSLHIS